ncbi:MBL fold metallo-hydrolase [Mycolicibacterium canariasense]|uniref:MBL fold metallo-hydrolase n=1 Tax=Mycolicibacterium canariasense TaxID=228230 RepID=UPI0007EA96E9|nr:MBL fold metallo-hydrolase [Mycolicibacterium canariasense]
MCTPSAVPIGDLTIIALHDGDGVETARDILSRPGAPDGWACYADHLDPEGALTLPLGGFLVRTGTQTVLIDAGVGDFDDGKYRGGDLLTALRRHGVEPGDVTDVVFTHLHFDHIGWASHRGEVVFPNATYRVHQADWDHFVTHGRDEHILATLTPITPQLAPFHGDVPIAPGVDAVFTPGHTPGTTIFVVSSRGERALLLGDVVHSVVQFTERDWEVIWDTDPTAARTARNRIADEIADTADLVVAAHLPDMRFGRIVTTGGPRRFVAV